MNFSYGFNSDAAEAAAQAAVLHQQLQNTRKAHVQQAQQQQQHHQNLYQQQQHQQQSNPYYQHRNVIFADKQNRSLLFYIKPNDPLKSKYKNLIIQYGGVVIDDPGASTTTIYLSNTDPLTTSFKWIDDSIAQNTLLPMSAYQIDNSSFDDMIALGQIPDEPLVKKGKGTSRFTPEQDSYIIEQIRANPTLRNSHKFFDKLSTHPTLRGHTGNSIRSRYRRHLSKDLIYIYKQGPDGKMIKDENGEYIKVSLEQIETLKKKFTPEDDYQLCMEAVQYQREKCESDGREFDINDDIEPTFSFYNTMYRKNSSHSVHSWRDRFRRHVTRGTIPKYIEYYDKCIKDKVQPNVLTRLNKYTEKPKESTESQATESKTTESKATEPKATEPNVTESTATASKATKSTKTKVIKPKATKKSKAKTDSNNLKKLNEEINKSEIDDSLLVRQAGDQHIEVPKLADLADDSQDKEETQQTQKTDIFSQLQSQVPNCELKYIPKEADLDDLINDEFYEFIDSDLSKQIESIVRISDESKTVEELFSKLGKIGFTNSLICHLILATGCDTKLLGIIANIFIQNLRDYVTKDYDKPTFKLLRFGDIPGVWDDNLDFMLNKGKFDQLLQYQSRIAIDQRKEFLKGLEMFGLD
ncbi:unnamed protein product [Candida verbasci]|uniref:DNA-binding protein RAP1 n=1 Tax=Candida verbasci TaxID=1227364 RepID=A0A9W4TV99_9ASCO|nr:unnamed protein product [Candida verbasci]